ncbi:MAG: hypothetical protein AMS22_08430 [Thiotrichales bacterium SG8_50]|nr:MAG: hypothetical protein AMS22_08430 [Thiotrichales bacterium SG8_50]
MRTLEYLSPSSLATWECNREEFYLKYLTENRPPRQPQENYMSIGSAFDAYVKSRLALDLWGQDADPQFDFETIFTDQVEQHNRDWARQAGYYALKCYQVSGAYYELLDALELAAEEPQFEFGVSGEVEGVPLFGKPDCRYITHEGTHVILDWKVNGFCSKYGASPYKGYAMIRDGWDYAFTKPSRGQGRPHKMYTPRKHSDLVIGRHYLEETSKDWADQLSIYGWMLGEAVGDENVVVCIDQLACKPNGEWPLIRVASHRCRVSEIWQQSLIKRLQDCWSTIQSGHIFNDTMSKEESDARCEILDGRATVHNNVEEGGIEEWVCEISRESTGFRAR